jgi:hypothetical protein
MKEDLKKNKKMEDDLKKKMEATSKEIKMEDNLKKKNGRQPSHLCRKSCNGSGWTEVGDVCCCRRSYHGICYGKMFAEHE